MSKPHDDVSATLEIISRLDKGNADKKHEQTHQCPLCGYKFSWEEKERVCQACSLKKRCRLIICPRCHHEFPKT